MRYRPIRRNSEFGRVYARGKSYVNPALVLYVLCLLYTSPSPRDA